ncbi:endo-1,4-beta-xylanase [Glycomyces sp. TRM65418]|uniref:endo-1,4-beta-xylanase n=1 Tax=Glycomyces sp. TRM65418 TaxID=2867006 RepID=UPI001CE5ABAD|nr:endo-1,4-beta-xylanase [Glycomyces sp. TRM65418]MCC3765464.1 endo-1,4-beta-xylanase [Glycomyces sp. TRM65418]QZD55073.1 endo-1,4-beta-xylanase [Glycomyces sp. TRM65418]
MLLTRQRRRAVIAGVVTVATAALGLGLSTQFASAQTTLRGAADDIGIDIGVAVNDSLLQNNQAYRELVAREFNSVTAENVMKMESVQPSQGQFNFAPGDRLVNFAQQNDMSVYGHTLVWHSQSPDWVENLSGTALRQAMENHITTTMNHWEGDIFAWDVVNEVVGDNNGQLRDSFWLQGMGENYIRWAFEAARAADPNADLYMNDYSIDGVNAKSDRYYQIAQDLVARDLLDGMGFQAHLILGQVPGTMEQNLQRFADLGLKVRITELDVRIQMPASQQELEQQAQDFQRVVEICTNIADCSGVTVWGVRDGDSWVPDVFEGYGAPLLFNDNNQPKPAYHAVLEALGGDGGPTTPPTSDPVTTTPPPTGSGCTATLTVQSPWNTGATYAGTVKANQSLSGWTVTWTWPGSERISNAWSIQGTLSGATVTASNVGYNGTLSAGQSTSFGFNITKPDGSTASVPTVTCTPA